MEILFPPKKLQMNSRFHILRNFFQLTFVKAKNSFTCIFLEFHWNLSYRIDDDSNEHCNILLHLLISLLNIQYNQNLRTGNKYDIVNNINAKLKIYFLHTD